MIIVPEHAIQHGIEYMFPHTWCNRRSNIRKVLYAGLANAVEIIGYCHGTVTWNMKPTPEQNEVVGVAKQEIADAVLDVIRDGLGVFKSSDVSGIDMVEVHADVYRVRIDDKKHAVVSVSMRLEEEFL